MYQVLDGTFCEKTAYSPKTCVDCIEQRRLKFLLMSYFDFQIMGAKLELMVIGGMRCLKMNLSVVIVPRNIVSSLVAVIFNISVQTSSKMY